MPPKRNRPHLVTTIAADVRAALRARATRTGETEAVLVEAALRSFLDCPVPVPVAPVLPRAGA
jgi:hypothetical protein